MLLARCCIDAQCTKIRIYYIISFRISIALAWVYVAHYCSIILQLLCGATAWGFNLPLNLTVSKSWGQSSDGWSLMLDMLKSFNFPDSWSLKLSKGRVIFISFVVILMWALFCWQGVNDCIWLKLQLFGIIFHARVVWLSSYAICRWLSSIFLWLKLCRNDSSSLPGLKDKLQELIITFGGGGAPAGFSGNYDIIYVICIFHIIILYTHIHTEVEHNCGAHFILPSLVPGYIRDYILPQ